MAGTTAGTSKKVVGALGAADRRGVAASSSASEAPEVAPAPEDAAPAPSLEDGGGGTDGAPGGGEAEAAEVEAEAGGGSGRIIQYDDDGAASHSGVKVTEGEGYVFFEFD